MSNSKDRETLRLLYRVSIDDIGFSKRQQWYVMYLTIIAIAGILSLSLEILCDHTFIGCLLFIFGILIPVLGLYMIRHYEEVIEKKYRPRMSKIRNKLLKELSGEVRKCFEEKPEKDIVRVFRVIIFLVLVLAVVLHISLWFSCPDCP